jgi:acyl dehydratase
MPQILPAHEVVAFNTATSSENRIHDDAVAARLGFAGGLVPGVDVYAYLCRPAIEQWGAAFCSSSRVYLRLDGPVYDGDRVEVRSTIDGNGVMRAEAHTTNGLRARIEAALTDDPPAPPLTAGAPLPAMAARPPASPDTLAAGTVLGSLTATCTPDELAAYLTDVRDETSPVAGLGLVHPGWLLRPANHLLSSNVVLGPWMHVESLIHHHRPVLAGEKLSVQGHVRDSYERKGHRFVVIDAVLLGPDSSVRCAIEHTAIFEPRQLRNDTG